MGDVESVFAHSATRLVDIEAEDTGVAVLKFRNGALGIIEASTFSPAKSSLTLLAELIASDIPAYLIKCGQPLEEALSRTRQALK